MLKKPPSGRRGQGQEALPLPHPACLKRRVEFHELRGSGLLPISAEQREKMEWEALSLNVFRHPLSPYRHALRRLGVVPSVEILELSHGCARAAGLLESLQRPPTKSGRPVYFLLIEDETGLLQATIFERVYERYGHILHRSGAFFLEGKVETDRRRGHSYLVERVSDLAAVLSGEGVPEPKAVPANEAFVRAGRSSGRRRRRAG